MVKALASQVPHFRDLERLLLSILIFIYLNNNDESTGCFRQTQVNRYKLCSGVLTLSSQLLIPIKQLASNYLLSYCRKCMWINHMNIRSNPEICVFQFNIYWSNVPPEVQPDIKGKLTLFIDAFRHTLTGTYQSLSSALVSRALCMLWKGQQSWGLNFIWTTQLPGKCAEPWAMGQFRMCLCQLWVFLPGMSSWTWGTSSKQVSTTNTFFRKVSQLRNSCFAAQCKKT